MHALALIAALAAAQLDVLDRAIELHVEGRIEEALAEYDRSLEGLDDPIDRAVAHNNACLILVDLERYEEALERCRTGGELLAGSDQTALLADNRTNLALALQSLGDLEGARAALQEALDLTLLQEDPELESMTRSNLGAVLTELGRFGEAAQQYRAVEQRATAAAGQAWALEQAAIARVNRAVLLFELGDSRTALTLLDEGTRAALPGFALEIGINRSVLLARLGDPVRSLQVLDSLPDSAGAEAAIRVDRSVAYRMLGRLDESIAEAAAAIAVARGQSDLLGQMRAHYQLARSLEERGDPDAARRAAEAALDLARESSNPEGLWATHTLMARLRSGDGQGAQADRHLEEALRLLETTRRATPDLALRATFQGSWREVYETAHSIWAQRARGGDETAAARAFEVVQRAKSRSLLDVLSRGTDRARPRSLESVQSRLGDDLLVEFFVDEDRVWRWTVRAGSARVDPVEAGDEVERLVRDLAASARGATVDVDAGERLADLLLPAGLSDDRLHIAPDGFLHELPFELLRDEGGFLGIDHALIYWPSGSFLDAIGAPHAAARFAAVAAPLPPVQAPAGIEDGVWGIWSTALPEARSEVAGGIERLGLPGESVEGAAATEAAFWRLAEAGPAVVVHVAAHAVVDPEPGSSAILLSPGAGGDGLLRQQEIANRDLEATLAVLAACRSVDLAGGRTGDALNSLTGAFLAAGTEAVIASRWGVSDAGSRALMEQLYHYLGTGLTAAEALRAARARLVEAGYADRPDIWAAYISVGDARVLAPRGDGWGPVALAAMALLAAAAALWTAARRQRPIDVS